MEKIVKALLITIIVLLFIGVVALKPLYIKVLCFAFEIGFIYIYDMFDDWTSGGATSV